MDIVLVRLNDTCEKRTSNKLESYHGLNVTNLNVNRARLNADKEFIVGNKGRVVLRKTIITFIGSDVVLYIGRRVCRS